MKAYHFLKDNMEAGSGREPAWKIGEEREYKGKLILCAHGYHSSPTWYDALQYAPGRMACIVKIRGHILEDKDKQVSSKRKLVDARNAEKILRTFACDCAERALKRAKVGDERSWNAIKAARLFNEGKVTKIELVAAGAAARAAARAAGAAARDAAGAAARAAAWDAAGATARAAWAAAGAAARDAAWAAAWAAEVRWQKRHLNKLMKELFRKEENNADSD